MKKRSEFFLFCTTLFRDAPRSTAFCHNSRRTYRTARRFLAPEEGSDLFLSQVENTVEKVLKNHNLEDDILALPSNEREAVGVARHLRQRLENLRRNDDCPRCWMQRAHCICSQCPPVSKSLAPTLGRIFLLLHHKEIAMKVDTAKLILAAFPTQSRLVVGGIGSEYQDSMKEMTQAMKNKNCLVLFPDETAQTFSEIVADNSDHDDSEGQGTWDVIVIDGTWSQARKLQARYIPSLQQGGPRRVQLSDGAVELLERGSVDAGHQLRRHSIAWRQVGTFEATRLFLRDCLWEEDTKGEPVWEQIQPYQDIANLAARRELGPPRTK